MKQKGNAGLIRGEDNGFSMGIKALATLEDSNLSQIMALVIRKMIINQITIEELQTKTIMVVPANQTMLVPPMCLHQ